MAWNKCVPPAGVLHFRISTMCSVSLLLAYDHCVQWLHRSWNRGIFKARADGVSQADNSVTQVLAVSWNVIRHHCEKMRLESILCIWEGINVSPPFFKHDENLTNAFYHFNKLFQGAIVATSVSEVPTDLSARVMIVTSPCNFDAHLAVTGTLSTISDFIVECKLWLCYRCVLCLSLHVRIVSFLCQKVFANYGDTWTCCWRFPEVCCATG